MLGENEIQLERILVLTSVLVTFRADDLNLEIKSNGSWSSKKQMDPFVHAAISPLQDQPLSPCCCQWLRSSASSPGEYKLGSTEAYGGEECSAVNFGDEYYTNPATSTSPFQRLQIRYKLLLNDNGNFSPFTEPLILASLLE